ncbi:MAG: hypothetical protein RMM28_01705 [Thermoleophilia bacterium]|nr:hypothetical protein [Gaiellaceae bacterium]MDW8337839.1 hypothetical protein [Thermoleophilia bacterium]
MTVLLVAQVVSTLMLVGLVWFVQIVHYPLFSAVPRAAFAAYERAHAKRTTWLVAPLMSVEAACALSLLVAEPGALTGVGMLLVVAIWLSTWLVQVPCHRLLEQGWDEAAHRRLLRTNWFRTALWSVRGVIAIALLA